MVNKKGWLRIVEASIAIVVIFSVLIIVNSTQRFSENADLTRVAVPLLDEISKNITMRSNIINLGQGSEPEIREFLKSRIKQSTIKFDVAVCETSEICSLPVYPAEATEIYASERVISSTLQEFSPKKVKIFVWYGNSNN